MGGCPRSGTTLLQVMLDMHPEMGMPRETNFIRELWWRRRHFGDLRDAANRRRVAEWIFSDKEHLFRRLIHRRITREEAIEHVAASPPTIGSIIERCLRLHAHDTPRFGDKRPAYSGFVGPLLQMFPDAQYVNVIRDPRGVAASQAAMGWDQPDLVVPAALVRWEFAVGRTDHYARKLRPDQLLDVRYEDLVADPARPDHARARVRRAAGGRRRRPARERGARRLVRRAARTRGRAGDHRVGGALAHPPGGLPDRASRGGHGAADGALRVPPRGGAEPTRHERAMLAYRRRVFRRRWRRTRRDDLLRELRYRRPVLAAGHE